MQIVTDAVRRVTEPRLGKRRDLTGQIVSEYESPRQESVAKVELETPETQHRAVQVSLEPHENHPRDSGSSEIALVVRDPYRHVTECGIAHSIVPAALFIIPDPERETGKNQQKVKHPALFLAENPFQLRVFGKHLSELQSLNVKQIVQIP